MNITENELRDFLFANFKENLASIITGKKEPIEYVGEEFPSIHFLLQQRTEKKINKLIDCIEHLTLTAKELRLVKEGDSTTRIDLFGNSEESGLTIIELKKSTQTERQAFTELLAYANHFSLLFPGLDENKITSILIAPMETRIVRDSFVQELVVNNKNILSLVPEQHGAEIKLKVYYPDDSYYEWFENNIFNDSSMLTVAISFQNIDGMIDTDIETQTRDVPDYSKRALNTISSSISHELESRNIHALVYASQKWGEIAHTFMFPNTIFVVAINPFSSTRTVVCQGNCVAGQSHIGRLEAVQEIYDQLNPVDRDCWIETMESNYHGYLIKTVEEQFNLCFKSANGNRVGREISLPNWYGIKTSMVDAVLTHNLDIYLTGLLREIYLDYIEFVYKTKLDHIYFSDDIPAYSYRMLRDFLPVWEIISVLGVGNETPEEPFDFDELPDPF